MNIYIRQCMNCYINSLSVKNHIMESWAKKELAKLRIYKYVKPRLPRINSAPVISSSQKPLAQEVILAADLGCPRCRKRVTDVISSSTEDVESIVVHVTQKKVTFTRTSVAEGSSTKVPAVFNNLACKNTRNIPLLSFHN